MAITHWKGKAPNTLPRRRIPALVVPGCLYQKVCSSVYQKGAGAL